MTIPIFDGHNDTLTHIHRPERGKGRTFLEASEVGHVDLPRAREGGMIGGFFAIFTPPPPEAPKMAPKLSAYATEDGGYAVPLADPIEAGYARAFTDAVLDLAESIEAESEGEVAIVRDAAGLDASREGGALGMILHIEGAEVIDEDLSNLEGYYDRGLRSVGLVWSRPNAFGHGVPFEFPRSPDVGPGLTDAGGALVRACNELGVMVDLAHLNEAGFWDVAELSEAPLVVTHSNVHALCPSTRNLTDAQIDAVAASGGVIGINFCPAFLREDGGDEVDTPLEEVFRHAAYVIDRVGIDHVCFGSDFDGAKVPAELGDASGLQKLFAPFVARGLSRQEMEQIGWKNWRRVLGDTWG